MVLSISLPLLKVVMAFKCSICGSKTLELLTWCGPWGFACGWEGNFPFSCCNAPHNHGQLTKLGLNVNNALGKLSIGGLLALHESLNRVLKVLLVGRLV